MLKFPRFHCRAQRGREDGVRRRVDGSGRQAGHQQAPATAGQVSNSERTRKDDDFF
jgi:hypothetical protein